MQRKRAHILAWHPDRLKAMNLVLRQDKLVPWSAKCVWKCPLCHLGILPSVKPSVRYSLRIEHHKTDHPDADAKLFRLRRSVAGVKKATVAKLSAGVAKRLLDIKAGKQGDHQVIFLSIPCTGNETKKRNGVTRVACAKCTALAPSVAGLAAFSCVGEKRAGPKRGQLLARMRRLVNDTNVTEQQRAQAQQVLDVLSPPQNAEQPVVHDPIKVKLACATAETYFSLPEMQKGCISSALFDANTMWCLQLEPSAGLITSQPPSCSQKSTRGKSEENSGSCAAACNQYYP